MIRPLAGSVPAALLGAAILAVAGIAAGLAWPGSGSARARTEAAADAVLQRVAARERTELSVGHRYVPFGPSRAGRDAILPGLDLGPSATAFDVDALPDPSGGLHLRAVSRPDAIRGGAAMPAIRTLDLAAGPPADAG